MSTHPILAAIGWTVFALLWAAIFPLAAFLLMACWSLS